MEIVHWKPIPFTISRNKVGLKIAEVMNIILTRALEDGAQSECAMFCTIVMPHLLLANSKSKNYNSITKILSRKLGPWIRRKFDNLVLRQRQFRSD